MSKKRHLKVQVWIYFLAAGEKKAEARFLVLRTRADRGGFWQPVTGSVETGEELPAAALREAQEESGLKFAGAPRELGKAFEFESHGRACREQAYALQAAGTGAPPVVRLDPHEHVESRWVGAEEALAMIRYPSNQQMLQLLVDELGQNS